MKPNDELVGEVYGDSRFIDLFSLLYCMVIGHEIGWMNKAKDMHWRCSAHCSSRALKYWNTDNNKNRIATQNKGKFPDRRFHTIFNDIFPLIVSMSLFLTRPIVFFSRSKLELANLTLSYFMFKWMRRKSRSHIAMC